MLTFKTLLESISLEPRETDTGGDVVDDGAGGPAATCARAGVNTLCCSAGLGLAAVRVEDTLRSAAVPGVSQEARGTGAPAGTVRGCGSGSWPTGVGLTDIVLN